MCVLVRRWPGPTGGRLTIRRRGSAVLVLAPRPGPPLGPHDQDYPHERDRKAQDGVVGVVCQQGHEGHDHNTLESISAEPEGIARGPISSSRSSVCQTTRRALTPIRRQTRKWTVCQTTSRYVDRRASGLPTKRPGVLWLPSASRRCVPLPQRTAAGAPSSAGLARNTAADAIPHRHYVDRPLA